MITKHFPNDQLAFNTDELELANTMYQRSTALVIADIGPYVAIPLKTTLVSICIH